MPIINNSRSRLFRATPGNEISTAQKQTNKLIKITAKAANNSGFGDLVPKDIIYEPTFVNGDKGVPLTLKNVGYTNGFDGSPEKNVSSFEAWGLDYPITSVSSNVSGSFTINGATSVDNEFIKEVDQQFIAVSDYTGNNTVNTNVSDTVFHLFFAINYGAVEPDAIVWLYYYPCKISNTQISASESGFVPFSITINTQGEELPRKLVMKKNDVIKFVS